MILWTGQHGKYSAGKQSRKGRLYGQKKPLLKIFSSISVSLTETPVILENSC
jgi:hypothetical protein